MATTPIGPTAAVNPGVVSGTTPVSAADAAANAASSSGLDKNTIAGNFQTFLTLLTTQLKKFAQVEQQLKSNTQLGTLVSLQQTAQNTAALNFVGQKVDVAGATTALTNGTATWQMSVPKPATATVTIKSATGQQVFSGNYALNAGTKPFT